METKTLVIFAGGKGSRLGAVGKKIPKPAVKVNEKPLVSYLVSWAAKNNLKSVLIAAGYKFEKFVNILEEFYEVESKNINDKLVEIPNSELKLTVLNTGEDSQTAHRLLQCKNYLPMNENFVVTYGDTLTDFDLKNLISFHSTEKPLISFVIGRPDARYGEIETKENLVTAFNEKERPKFYVNRGFFLTHHNIFDFLDDNINSSFEKDVMPKIVSNNRVCALKSESNFFSVDTEVDLGNLSDEIRKNKELF